jgi:hypothetical protein
LSTNDLVGAWELVSMENHGRDGQVSFPWGRGVSGRLIYTADGWMSAFVAKLDRPSFSAGDLFGGSTEELVNAARSWISYCGRYTYQDGVVTHHVELSFFPNWVGDDQRRYVEMSDQTLTLTTPPIMQNGENRVAKLVWRRLS